MQPRVPSWWLRYAIGWGLFERSAAPARLLWLWGPTCGAAATTSGESDCAAWRLYAFPTGDHIASGATSLDLGTFALASLVSRAGRFFLVAALLYWFGPPIRRFIEAWLPQLAALFFLLLFGGFLALRYVF